VSSGLVSLAAKNRMAQQIILNPGNAGIYDKTSKELEIITRADPNAMAWKTREIVFSETPLGEVVKVISHVYQTDVQLSSTSLATCPITVSFQNQELGAVLNVVTSTLDLQMERREGAFVLSGEGCD
jgi:ferric-dicitrate binding protein FerR (iron transport regulator)